MRDKGIRLKILLFLLFLVPLGFYSKFYDGPAALWVNNSFSGILYEMFWCVVVLFFLPAVKPLYVTLWVFAITSLLETLQLWHPPLLQSIRSTFIGQTLIGTSFVWSDFFYYLTGCVGGFSLLYFLQNHGKN